MADTDTRFQRAAAADISLGHGYRKWKPDTESHRDSREGPYQQVPETIAIMAEHMADTGLRPAGNHHEVYLSDPRRVPPERLRTILRQPIARAR